MFKNEIMLIALVLILVISIIAIYFSNEKIKQTVETSTASSECSSSLSFSLSGNGTCNLTTSILNKNCENKKYEIKNDYANCSDTIKSNEELVFCNWQIPFGNHTYSLYIDNELKASQSITCPKFISCTVCPKS